MVSNLSTRIHIESDILNLEVMSREEVKSSVQPSNLSHDQAQVLINGILVLLFAQLRIKTDLDLSPSTQSPPFQHLI